MVVRNVGVRIEGLLTVEQEVVALVHGADVQCGKIRTCLGFGVAEAELHLPPRNRQEPFVLHCLAAEMHDRGACHVGGNEDQRYAHIGHLLTDGEGHGCRCAQPPVFHRPVGRQPAVGRKFLDELPALLPAVDVAQFLALGQQGLGWLGFQEGTHLFDEFLFLG